MKIDVERWDAKYARAGDDDLPPPDPVLMSQRLPRAGGLAIDIACGRGANTAYLAEIGFHALGVDCSFEALRRARALVPAPRVQFVVADLDDLVLPARRFDLIVVVKYLNREIVPALRAALKPGGLVFYRTFNRRHLDSSPRFNPAFVLETGELGRMFAGFEPVAGNENGGESAPLSYLLARRPSS